MAGRIMSIEKPNDLIRTRTPNLPACSTIPPPTTLPEEKLDDKEARLKHTPRKSLKHLSQKTGVS
jgi:hypothetical protein